MTDTVERIDMIHERVNLRKDNPEIVLDTYVCRDLEGTAPRRAVLVLPGGGYCLCAHHEGEHIALSYLAAGINAFVLNYSTTSNTPDLNYPAPLVDASNAMKYIRDNAERFNIDKDKICVLGFSAGGHLAGMLGTIWHRQEVYDAAEPMEFGYNKPNGMILCYAVASAGKFAHRGSFDNLLCGGDSSEAKREYLSNELNVDERTCPAFLWHTSDDTCVPVENTLLMAGALSANKIPFEVHIYPHGNHGLGLPNGDGGFPSIDGAHISTWMPLSIEWIKSL